MVCDAVEVLPQPSVAVHVLVTLYDPAHAPGVVTSAKVNVKALPHASVAVAVANTGVAGPRRLRPLRRRLRSQRL